MNYDGLVPMPRTRFYRVKCPGCGNEQNVFSAASRKLMCLACNAELGSSHSSKVRLKAKIVKEME